MCPLPDSDLSTSDPDGVRKAADADLLGEAALLKLPAGDKAGDTRQLQTPELDGVPALPQPPPAEDENQPGFIGERNRPTT